MKKLAFMCSLLALLLFSAVGAASAAEEAGKIEDLNWQSGPLSARIGASASIELPKGYAYLDNPATQQFMALTQNLTDDTEFLIAPEDLSWFAVFSFEPTGYVKDDEVLDPEPILESVREGTELANEERKRRGWDALNILGWRFQPQYDKESRLLEWAFRARNEGGGEEIINYNTRILGRTGVMEVVLVADPEQLDPAVAALKERLTGFSYDPGQRYAEFEDGDHIAEYGLAALIAGGAAAVATKKGFWAVLAAFLVKGWKLVLLAFVGLGALAKKMFSRKDGA